MHDHSEGDEAAGRDRYRAADARTQAEVGGILERAFQRESGREPREEEGRRFIALAQEAEAGAEAAESLADEAERQAAEAAERHARTGAPDDLAAIEHWQAEAETHRRRCEALRLEAERLRHYRP